MTMGGLAKEREVCKCDLCLALSCALLGSLQARGLWSSCWVHGVNGVDRWRNTQKGLDREIAAPVTDLVSSRHPTSLTWVFLRSQGPEWQKLKNKWKLIREEDTLHFLRLQKQELPSVLWGYHIPPIKANTQYFRILGECSVLTNRQPYAQGHHY